MDVQHLDAIVRMSGVTLLCLLAAILLRDARGHRVAALFAPLAVCLSGFLIGNTPDPALRLSGLVGGTAHLLSGYAAVFLWWFCLASFDPKVRLRGPLLAVGAAWIVIASVDRGLLGPDLADRGLSWLLVAIGFGMVAHLVWRLIRDREGDLLESRRQARALVAPLLAAQLLADLAVDVAFGLEWRPRGFAITQNLAILAFTIWLVALLLRANPAALWSGGDDRGPAQPAGQSVVPESEKRLAERLRTLIEVEQVHLDTQMTFSAFVRRMGASERAVRQFINQRLGHDHFRSFLNAHRLAEARRLLADPSRAHDKLISIALDSGFASLASFNRVFRASEACAPSAYRNALQAASATGSPTQDSASAVRRSF